MKATWHMFIHSRRLPWRVVRVTLFAAVGWWLTMEAIAFARVSPLLLETQWGLTDFSRASVDLDEIQSGGPPKDGIPAIDRPAFVDNDAAAAWLDAREPVISVEIDGRARAYPLQILMFHEIVNDEFGGTPIAVTFCPLCNASIVFDRRIAGRVLDFGTTGLLRKSDLVMYDRQTESWWQQFSGKGIVGEFTGTELGRVAAHIVAFGEFAAAYPDGDVLSRDTGYSRSYGSNPYRGYDRVGNNPFLFDDPTDPRLPAMERVLNVSLDGIHRLYPFSLFRETPLVNDSVAGTPVVVMSRFGTLSVLDRGDISASRSIYSASAFERRLDGRELRFETRDGTIVDSGTGSTWNLLGHAVAGPLRGARLRPVSSGVHFAFAWLAFNPDSEIYRADN